MLSDRALKQLLLCLVQKLDKVWRHFQRSDFRYPLGKKTDDFFPNTIQRGDPTLMIVVQRVHEVGSLSGVFNTKKVTIFGKTRLASPRVFLNVPKRSRGQYYVGIDSLRAADDHPTPPDDRDRASRSPTDRSN